MKRLRIAPVLLFLAAAAPVLAQSPGEPPTLFERWKTRREKNPELEKKLARGAEVMKKLSFMVGRFEVTEKTFASSMKPDPPKTGVRESRFDLDGRSLVSRTTVGQAQTVDALVYDPYQEYWFRQILSNFGRTALQPLVATAGWDNDALTFTGTLWAFGEKADVKLRIQKFADGSYTETWEERFQGISRPLMESTFRKLPDAKAGQPK